MYCGSFFRDLKHMSALEIIAASTMFIALLLTMIFAGVQDHPAGYKGDPITIRAWAAPGSTFVEGLGTVQVLNITYGYVGQMVTLSDDGKLTSLYCKQQRFIGDMRNPEDFPKALYISMAAELLLTFGGAIIYWKTGEEYVTSPAYGALLPHYRKAVAGTVLPTIISGYLQSSIIRQS
ncbi:hypothetical protein BS47DRAFT_1364797 [Hydnum rufescens UP504]|uniref:Uncharacterized protein n=1 Tax=Hydnum rufescens UP504 TaxID=1448309 RepID=A0A9P6AQD9_9AGAM|nr:hypothetical protein BS47DRAFT_1364797 [Hydnum rufescens UP504]